MQKESPLFRIKAVNECNMEVQQQPQG